MNTVKFGETASETIKKQSVIAITLGVYAQHTTVNTAFAGQPVDFSLITATMILKRGGKSFTIFDDIALPLLMESGFATADFEQVNGVSNTIRVITAHGAAQKAIIQISGEIRLHDIVNLRDDDELIIEVNPTAAAAAAAIDQTVSYVYWDIKEGVGNALSIPKIEVRSVQAGKTSETYSLGDNVTDVTFINNDKSGITAANQVISSVQITSDKLNRRDDIKELIGKRSKKFASVALADARHNCFQLLCLDDEKVTLARPRLNGTDVRIGYVGGNVTASKNWVVSRSFYNDGLTLGRAAQRDTKHKAANVAQVK